MNILILTPTLPYPPNDGLRVRMLQAIRSLASSGDITLISFIDVGASEKDVYPVDKVQSQGGINTLLTVQRPIQTNLKRLIYSALTFRTSLERAYHSETYLRLIKNTLSVKRFDFCIILGGSLLFGYIFKLKEIRVVVDLCDDLLVFYSRRALISNHIFRKFYYKIQRYFYYLSLKNASSFVDKFVFISEEDAKCMSFFGYNNYRVIPNYVDNKFFKKNSNISKQNYELLFVGAMASNENIDAVNYFCSNILPIVHSKNPDIVFRIVGKGASQLQHLAFLKNVALMDYVDDLYREYASCAVFVCPLRSGAGVKNKILEAMAVGCAIVTTSVGAEGIGCRHGKELFIADGPKEFANRIITLIDNQSARECFSKNARRFVKDNFSKENTENKWRQLLLTQS